MNSETEPTVAAQTTGNTLRFWPRFRATYGPALVGLVGGVLTVGIGLPTTLAILKNVAQTYAKYPTVPDRWPAQEFAVPEVIVYVLAVFGMIAPFAVGWVTVHLVRPKDQWNAVSAGLTAGAAGSVAAYVASLGWATTLAMVVVPSIADITLLAHSTQTPTGASAHPTDPLAERYPDLKSVPADERGAQFFPKIMADQIIGAALGVWLGAFVSVLTLGVPAFCGTLVATWLVRRGGSRWGTRVAYVELTVVTALFVCAIGMAAIEPSFRARWPQWVALAAATAVVVAGVIGRWGWLLRITAAACWGLLVAGVGFTDRVSAPATAAGSVAYLGLAALLVQRWVGRRGVPPPRQSATRLVMPA